MMSLIRFKLTVKLGVKSIWMHRLRSVLTMLGIVFGVCSVIAMLAIGEGGSREAQRAIDQLGTTNLLIETVKPPEDNGYSTEKTGISCYGLTYSDAENIRNTIPDVEVVVPIRETDQEARYLNRNMAVRLIGTVPWYTQIARLKVVNGRFLTNIDLEYNLTVCVVEQSVAEQLFTFDDPLGQDLTVLGTCYKVVGIVSGPSPDRSAGGLVQPGQGAGSSSGASGNIYIPLTTAKDRISEYTGSFAGGRQGGEKIELQKITVQVNSPERVLAVRDVVEACLSRTHTKKDFRIVVPLELLRQAARTRRIFSVVLGSIAGISLLVGGIGIMNIMLATVSERTREIGIRRALGARKKDIVTQFLSETLLLTVVGGIVGIIVGSIIPAMVTYFVRMPTVITGGSLVLAFGISAGVGVVFGLYPAYRAANTDPIESLRHE